MTTNQPLNADNLVQGQTATLNPGIGMGRMPAFAGLAQATGGLYVEEQQGMTIDTALRKAGLDFTVEALPDVQAAYTDDNGVGFVTHPDYRLNVARHRDGRVTPVGMTKGRYQIVQNTDAYAFGEILLGEGGANVAAAGQYGSPMGSKTYLALRLDPFSIAGDPHQMHLTIINSYDATSGLIALLAPIRLACTNQTTATFGRKATHRISLRHTAHIEGRIEEARQVLGLVERWEVAFQKAADALLHEPMNEGQFIKFAETLWAPPKEDATKRTVNHHNARMGELQTLFAQSPTNEFGRGTRYAAYNTVTEYLDWYAPVRGGDSPEVTRYSRTLGGDRDDVKIRAFNTLVPTAALA